MVDGVSRKQLVAVTSGAGQANPCTALRLYSVSLQEKFV